MNVLNIEGKQQNRIIINKRLDVRILFVIVRVCFFLSLDVNFLLLERLRKFYPQRNNFLIRHALVRFNLLHTHYDEKLWIQIILIIILKY